MDIGQIISVIIALIGVVILSSPAKSLLERKKEGGIFYLGDLLIPLIFGGIFLVGGLAGLIVQVLLYALSREWRLGLSGLFPTQP